MGHLSSTFESQGSLRLPDGRDWPDLNRQVHAAAERLEKENPEIAYVLNFVRNTLENGIGQTEWAYLDFGSDARGAGQELYTKRSALLFPK